MRVILLPKYHGFTLLELLLTIAIVAILGAISIPYLHDIATQHRRIVEQKRLVSAINTARSMAISHGRFVTLCPSVDNRRCTSDWQQPLMIFIDGDIKAEVDQQDYLLRAINDLSYGTLQLKAFPSKRYFRFHPDGFTDNQNGTFSYCYQHQGWQLIVNRAGRVRSEDGLKC